MNIDWSTASADEIIEQINKVRTQFTTPIRPTWQIPMHVYKMLAFKPVFTRVRKGPGKGRRKMLMVK